MDFDLIQDLRSRPFSSRSFQEKKIIIDTNRPMPEPTEKHKNRNFQKKSGITILIGCVAAKLMKKFTAGRVYCFSLKKTNMDRWGLQ